MIIVAADNLPKAAVLELDFHFRFVGAFANCSRERLVYAALASVGINRVEDGFAGLCRFGE
jgi:hypothetical protein